MKRIFLGWDRPALHLAVDFLVERQKNSVFTNDAEEENPGRVLDIADMIVAVPGSRAGRRLLELLVERCKAGRLTLNPPQIVTIGRLPELLYEARRPFANDLTQRLAWVEALKNLNVADIAGTDDNGEASSNTDANEEHSLRPADIFQRPKDDDLEAWMQLGTMFSRLHRELAADALNCGDVVNCGRHIEDFAESQRWKLLARVQDKYLRTLDDLGLWDRQTARLFAINHRECRVDKDVLLVGLVDMNRSQRQMLDQLGDRAVVLVFAPQELAGRFDQHGCLKPKAWLEADIDIPDECIRIVDGPSDQAAAAAKAIASFDGQFSSEEITVGVPDVRLVPHIERLLSQCDVSSRYGVGRRVAISSPYRFLADVAAYVSDRSFAAFATLVRHPHVGDWLRREGIKGDWLMALDSFHEAHMPHRLDKKVIASVDAQFAELLAAVYGVVERLVGVLDGSPRPLGDWGQPLVELLVSVFAGDSSAGKSKLDRSDTADRQILLACEKIRDVLRLGKELPQRLAPNVSGPEAVKLVLREVESETIPLLPRRGAIELLGWLELPWDDAVAVVVTGMNEGTVPSSLNADLFLPNKLRRELGIEDNDRRYARDAYALSLLAASRRELRLIAAHRTADGDPLAPTRLFFAADEETTARRAAAFFGEGGSKHPRVEMTILPGALQAVREQSLLEVPAPRPLDEPVRSMRVTEFRDYLACPYRYYLRHCLHLAALDDDAVELDAAAFGTLAHEVLRRFGTSSTATSTSSDAVAAYLSGVLDELVQQAYGSRPLASIRVQTEQLRQRLAAFARWQADWAAHGWRIERVEFGPAEGESAIVVDDQPMFLRGRIDRIDLNERTGRRALFDYKTSDTLKTPQQAHIAKGEWIDLQLPLYRYLVKGIDSDVMPAGEDMANESAALEMGYIVLPKDTGKAGYLKADWSATELREADEVAARVVRAVREERFFPPTLEPPAFAEEFAAICQDNRIGRPLLEGGQRFFGESSTSDEKGGGR